MENIAEKTAKDQDEMKEKVRVVSLVDPVMTKSNIGLGNNSNSSVWSLCDIHNDDTHIDLGDITPSISPTFTEEQVLELSEQQMVDPLTHRLLDDGDNIFSVDQIGHSLGAGQRKGSPLHDFRSDMDSFDREMQFIEELDGVRRGHGVLVTKELGMKTSNRDGKVGKNTNEEKDVLEGNINNENRADENTSSLKAQRRRSPRKQGSSREETATGMALRRRRQNQATVEKDESLDKAKSESVLVHSTVDEDKVKSGPVRSKVSRRSPRIAKHVVKEPEEDTEQRNDGQEEELSERDNETKPSAGEEKVVEKDEMVINKNEEDPDIGETKTKELLEKNTPEKKDTLPEIDVQGQNSSVLHQDNDTSKPASKEVIKEEEENSKNVKTASDTSAQKLTPTSPEKRVTRSTTGNLKPKQAFDEMQEKLELEKAKRLKKKTVENEKSKCEENDENTTKEGHLKEVNIEGQDNLNKQTADSGKTESKSTEQKREQDKAKDGKRKTKKEKGKSRKKSKANKSGKSSTESSDGEHDSVSSESSEAEVDFHADDSDYSPEDDPDRLWCICRKPHGNRFMICCDDCEEWFHGKCIGITMEQGRKMEKSHKEYVCDKCKEKKLKALMEEKARQEPVKTTTKPAIVREVYKHTRRGQKEPPAPVSAPVPALAPAPQPKLKPVSTVHVSSEPEEKKRKPKEPAGFKIPKKVRTTPTPVSHISHQPSQKCIGEGCPRSSFEGAVYCGRSCIERHVSHAIKMLTAKEHGGKLHTSEGNRVAVIEKCSGRVIAGMASPVMNHLTEWILKNPSFQVLVSGTSPTSHSSSSSSFYNKPTPEVKIKKEADRKNEEETIRSNVRRTMKEILVARKRESSDIRLSIEEIMKLVGIIEEGMHKAFKDTSHRYKAKYRTLMFNLKDPRNKVLYRRVLTGDIPPDKLIWMTSDELATKELAAWREQETKHMIDMIKKEEENTNKARLIKKTHKGEVDVDEDDLSTLESSNTKEHPEEEQTSSTEANMEVLLLDTTDEHRAHLFDLNCKICTGKMAPPGEVVAKSPASVTNVPIQAAAESSVPSPPREVTFVGPPSPDSHEFATASSPSKVPSKLQEKSVWKGFVMMQSVAKFGTNAYLVSGSADDLIQVLPDTLHVHGRIAHEQVWDYVFQCKTSSSREMSLIRFAAATDEEKISYVSLYSYFHSRKRCGVIGNCYSGVKDMYLIPLASHQPVPPELMPFKGPGLQEPRPHMLLGLIIRTKPATKRPRPVVDRQASSSPRAAGEPHSKRISVNGTDTSKSTTPNSKTTTPTLPDSPVDEIEDIVFHFHNSQAKLDSEAAKPKPSSSTQPIVPMVTALLKIQEQEKKLRSLQEQSERLEKEIAPKKAAAFPVFPAALSLSLDPSMSSVLSRLASSVTLIKNKSQPETSNETSNTAGDTDALYDPETAYDEETPYDPEDLDLSSEDKDVSGTESKETTVSASLSGTTPSTGGLPEVKGDTGRISFKITPTSQDLPQTFVKGERGTAMKSSAVVDIERTVPRVVPEKVVSGDEEYEKRVLGQGAAPAQDGQSRSDVNQDPRRSRYRHALAPDASQGRDFSEPRGHRDNRRDNDDSRRDTDDSKLHSSRARPNDRRWNDDRRDNYRERDDRQRGFFNRDRSHDRDRHSRDKWRR